MKKFIAEQISDATIAVPLEIQVSQQGAGLYRVVAFSENGKKVAEAILSDSMPNTMSQLNKKMLAVIDFIKSQEGK